MNDQTPFIARSDDDRGRLTAEDEHFADGRRTPPSIAVPLEVQVLAVAITERPWRTWNKRVSSAASTRNVAGVAVCAQVAQADDRHAEFSRVQGGHTVRRRLQRRLSRGGAALVTTFALTNILFAGCGSSSKPHADPTSVASTVPPSTASPTTQVTTARLGAQAFAAYRGAFGLIAQIEGSPAGRSTDPRLRQVLVDPWYSKIVQEINLYRLRNEVVRGAYSFSNFRLDDVTTDGRVIFTDCQLNSQAVYDAKTGALIGDSGSASLPEQVVEYHPTGSAWRVADDNAVTGGTPKICAG